MRHLEKHYIRRVLLAIDQLANVVFSPLLNFILVKNVRKPPAFFGYEDETLSSVLGKNSSVCRGCYWLCRGLHWLDKDHCKKSIESDEGEYINHG